MLFILRNNSVIHNCNVKITEEKKKSTDLDLESPRFITGHWLELGSGIFSPLEEEMRPQTEQAKFSSLPLTEAPDI